MHDILARSGLQQKEEIKFFNVLAWASGIMFFYVISILSGMYANRKMRTPIERLHIVNEIARYRRKTFLFYLIIIITYLVLILGEEKDGKVDWRMLA